jgi:hypothetical protein
MNLHGMRLSGTRSVVALVLATHPGPRGCAALRWLRVLALCSSTIAHKCAPAECPNAVTWQDGTPWTSAWSKDKQENL